MGTENPDIQVIKQLRIDVANDPEKFTEWEQNFVDSLYRQQIRNGKEFTLTPQQRERVDEIQDKANQ